MRILGWSLAIVSIVAAGCGVGTPVRTLPNGSPAVIVEVACAERLHPFMTSLSRLADSLAEGLTFEQYESALEDIDAVYRVTGFRDMSETCNDALGGPLEKIYLDYRGARVRWSLCLSDRDCDVEGTMRILRTIWTELAGDLRRAQYVLP